MTSVRLPPSKTTWKRKAVKNGAIIAKQNYSNEINALQRH